MIIYLASLQGVPQDVQEAATIDGVSPLQRFRYITVPLISGSFTICFTLSLGGGAATSYILVACEIIDLPQRADAEQKLIAFSVFSQMDEYVRRHSLGVAFHKEGKICFICKTLTQDELLVHIKKLAASIAETVNMQLGCVVSRRVLALSDVPDLFNECMPLLGCFYFSGLLPQAIIWAEKPVFAEKREATSLPVQRDALADAILRQDANLQALQKQYCVDAGVAAAGKRDVTTYELFSSLRAAEERLHKMKVALKGETAEDFLNFARTATSYQVLCAQYHAQMQQMFDAVTDTMRKSNKRDIMLAMDYIAQHYAENLSLEILAKHIHMNSFYFSSYFKKQTGKNFKDYLNQVRMQHAVELLITTNKKSYEIAECVGLNDYRHFTEPFSRYYGKTPKAYRKEQLQQMEAETEAKKE